MKHWNKVILTAAMAALVLMLPACGTDQPKEADLVSTKQTEAAIESTPIMQIHYTDEEAQCHAALTPSVSRITAGTDNSMEVQGIRPCEQETVCTFYSADPLGEARLAFADQNQTAALPLTVTAYPATEDGTVETSAQAGQTLAVSDGCFTLLYGWYYYELDVQLGNRAVTYGFIGYRTDEYEFTQTVSGCFVEDHEEDHDARTKLPPYLALYRPVPELDADAKLGTLLGARGQASWTYTNYAGTEITRTVTSDPDDSTSWLMANALAQEFEIELHGAYANGYHGSILNGSIEDPMNLIDKITVTRYPYGEETAVESFELTGNKLTFRGDSYYEFAVEYQNGYATYAVITGTKLPEAAHEKDDPTLDADTARRIRADYRTFLIKNTGTAPSVEEIFVEKYYGDFGSFAYPAVLVSTGAPTASSENRLVLGKYTIRLPESGEIYLYMGELHFVTLTDAYKKGHITEEELGELGALIDSSFREVNTADLPTDLMEAAPPMKLTRALPSTHTQVEKTLYALSETGVDTAAGTEMYDLAGIGSIQYNELPCAFTLQYEESATVPAAIVTRYPLYDHTQGELCEITEGKVTLEAGYYYEFAVGYTEGLARYGIVTEAEARTVDPDAPKGYWVHYVEDGKEKQVKMTASMLSASWNDAQPTQVMTTCVDPPYRLLGLQEIHTTEAEVTLSGNAVAYAGYSVPVDRNNEPIFGSDTEYFAVEGSSFALREGSYYYNIYVCTRKNSYTHYGFVAHYDPNSTQGERDPLWDIPLLENAPALRLIRSVYGIEGWETEKVLEYYRYVGTDHPVAPIVFSGREIEAAETPAEFRIVTDEAYSVTDITVRRYLPDAPSEWELCEIVDGKITPEAGWCYEFDVIYAEGRAFYTLEVKATPTEEKARPVLSMDYRYKGVSHSKTLYDTELCVTWTEQDGAVEITYPEGAQPHEDLSPLPLMKSTVGDVTIGITDRLTQAYVVAMAVRAYPLDADGKLMEGGEWVDLAVTADTHYYGYDIYGISLQEGLYYYEVYACLDANSYDIYTFTAIYTPES